MKYHIITYGCQMNESDSERIAAVLENTNYQAISDINKADLVVVNMCSIRQSAVDRVYGLLPKFKKLKNKNPKFITILTGCILKKDKKKFISGFDLVLNAKDLPKWPQKLQLQTNKTIKPNSHYLKISPKYQTNFQALIPISRGCNNFCAYCVVPFTRGPLVCRDHKEILKETKEAVQKGSKEIWLLGQNVNDYHSPTNVKVNFSKLLKQIDEIKGDFWIRFTSPHPKDFSNELIKTMDECRKVTEYLNLPVQSGDNEILKRMNRPYTVEEYKNLVKKIREKIPEITLSTDVIVGFPGETKKQFQNTAKLFREIKFDMAYIAKYSPRPSTRASEMEDDVPRQEKQRRWKTLTEILKETALEHNKTYVGKKVKVLVEKKKKEFLAGKTKTYKTIKFEGPKKLIGQFQKVKITKAITWGLKGKLI
ncbi:tRNA (N6-isopentenyl adenosine(37)-C2)-methylthiotransferase MiaB [Patescibacteria group bacterium]|nr:tRNA (N6-isopentenyl adenosine(37)-C2)-methylthiotransferase MiaB [Patescibacteria group bacterium]